VSEMMEMGTRILRSQPFSTRLGAELTAMEPGSAEITVVVREEHKQQHGFVHGGVVSYLADNCVGDEGETLVAAAQGTIRKVGS